MSELLDDYLRSLALERNASVHTVAAYRRDIVQFAELLRGDRAFDDWPAVDEDQARTFVYELFTRQESKRSIQRKLSALRSFFRYLVRTGSRTDNPFEHVSPPKQERNLPQVMSVDAVDRLVKAVREYWLQAEAFHRLAIGKKLPREFYAQKEELQQEWFSLAEGLDDAQLPELSRKAARDESAFFGRWRGALLSSRKGGRLFLGAWKKRDLLINASLHRPEN